MPTPAPASAVPLPPVPADPLLPEVRQSGLLLALLTGVLAIALSAERLLTALT